MKLECIHTRKKIRREGKVATLKEGGSEQGHPGTCLGKRQERFEHRMTDMYRQRATNIFHSADCRQQGEHLHHLWATTYSWDRNRGYKSCPWRSGPEHHLGS